MATIKVEVKVEDLEVKTRRDTMTVDINVKDGKITVHYLEEQYYINAESEEVTISSEPKSYQAGYDVWEESDIGAAITDAITAELIKDIPGA